MKKNHQEFRSLMRGTRVVKCIITLSNGLHKTIRFTSDRFVFVFSAVRSRCRDLFLTERYERIFREYELIASDCRSFKFLSEQTGQELITLSV